MAKAIVSFLFGVVVGGVGVVMFIGIAFEVIGKIENRKHNKNYNKNG